MPGKRGIWVPILASFFFLFFLSSGGWVKIKLKLPHFHVSDTCSCFDLAHAPVATAARAAATGLVCMSTRPDPVLACYGVRTYVSTKYLYVVMGYGAHHADARSYRLTLLRTTALVPVRIRSNTPGIGRRLFWEHIFVGAAVHIIHVRVDKAAPPIALVEKFVHHTPKRSKRFASWNTQMRTSYT